MGISYNGGDPKGASPTGACVHAFCPVRRQVRGSLDRQVQEGGPAASALESGPGLWPSLGGPPAVVSPDAEPARELAQQSQPDPQSYSTPRGPPPGHRAKSAVLAAATRGHTYLLFSRAHGTLELRCLPQPRLAGSPRT